jgi:TATA-binding protein-associated factor Taf7
LRSQTFILLQRGCGFISRVGDISDEPQTAVQFGRSNQMTRMERQALERKLEQTRRLALEPTDPLTRERLAQMIEELELQLRDWRKVA